VGLFNGHSTPAAAAAAAVAANEKDDGKGKTSSSLHGFGAEYEWQEMTAHM
jgi:hypothetical protein